MERKILGSVFDRGNRNNVNDNFKFLFESAIKLNTQMDNLVLESGGTSNAEVVQARAEYPTLNSRLNSIESFTEIEVSHEQPTNALIWFEVE